MTARVFPQQCESEASKCWPPYVRAWASKFMTDRQLGIAFGGFETAAGVVAPVRQPLRCRTSDLRSRSYSAMTDIVIDQL